MKIENENYDNEIQYEVPIKPTDKENIINVDTVLTPEEKEIFKKAADISREYMQHYELAKQKVLLEEESQGKKL